MKLLDISTQSLLAEAGLSQSERTVYAVTLEAGPIPSKEIIAKTRMPRPTVMAALQTLKDVGLCEYLPRDGRSFTYRMMPPAALKQHLGTRIRQLDSVVERLDQLNIDDPAALETEEAHGQEAVQELLELALRCKNRHWYIIAPHANALRFMPKSYTDYFKKVRRERQIVSQTLWEEGNKTENLPMHDILMRKPRHVPTSIGKNIPSLLLAFDDCVLIIDGTHNPSAALIRNQPAVQTFGILFEMAWRSVKP